MKKVCFDCEHCLARMNGEVFCGKTLKPIENENAEVDCKMYSNDKYNELIRQQKIVVDSYDTVLEHIADLYDEVAMMKEKYVCKQNKTSEPVKPTDEEDMAELNELFKNLFENFRSE